MANPGGGVEPGESPEEAARRELTEETGLVAGRLELIGAYGGPAFEVEYPPGYRTASVVTIFAGCHHEGEVTLQVDEVAEHAWIPVTELGSLSLGPEMPGVLDDAFAWPARRLQSGSGSP